MMNLVISFSIIFIPIVRACEGQCIVDITNAFIGNYSTQVQHVLADLAASVAHTILPSRSIAAASKLVEPLHNSYERGAYDTMEKAIFPGYFHGKCQVNGVDPAGCPNPDCPVVCGTPGSMVHFYNILKQIAFNTTITDLEGLCSPSSVTYKTFEAAVLHASHPKIPHRRSLRDTSFRSRSHYSLVRRASSSSPHEKSTSSPRKGKEMSDPEVKAQLMLICKSTAKNLENSCGGSTELPNCSWEKDMKAFILSFP